MALREYIAKRDFSRTREPTGGLRPSPKGPPRFVVQKHEATRLHYDFRLELDGVLKSWAVPRGFPCRRGDRRLAVEVEDHPLEYGGFEGTIPEGNYGAGTVMLWDTGTYSVSGDDPRESLVRGKLHFWLKGKKLTGEWTLVRLRGSGEKPQWLLLKSGEDTRPVSSRTDNRSVKSGRTMRQIAEGADPEWNTGSPNRPKPAVGRVAARQRPVQARNRKARLRVPASPNGAPAYLEPMKALPSKELPRGPEWLYEIKFDGIRLLAIRNGGSVGLFSRSRNDLTSRYAGLATELARLPAAEFVLDGELVALDENGRSSFQLLQSWHQSPLAARPPLVYYVFDALQADGRNLTGLPLCDRKDVARRLVGERSDLIRYSAGIEAETEALVREMKARGLEGLIAKKRDSRYEPGRRSGAWVKFKWSSEQEFVIGGFTEPRGGRQHFGAVLVGYYREGKLLFAGKVGTGFDERSLRSLHERFRRLVRPDCPFANLPEKRVDRFGGGMTASQMRLCTWVEPKLVGQVRFAEWTRDDHLRQPSFLGLREDKDPREVVRE